MKDSDNSDGNTSVLGDGGSKEIAGSDITGANGGSDKMAGGVGVDGDGDMGIGDELIPIDKYSLMQQYQIFLYSMGEGAGSLLTT